MARTHITRDNTGTGHATAGLKSYGNMLDPQRVEDIHNKLDEHDLALDAVEPVQSPTASIELISAAGALDPTITKTRLTVSGTMALTLANGTTDGQEKTIECVSAASTPLATLTVATMDTAGGGANATFVFTAAFQKIRLQWNAALAAWHMVEKVRAGQQAVVVGTTVLTGLSLAAEYALSVTGTVSSTTTKAVPSGQVPGERIHIMTPTAASTPVGNINIAGTTIATGVAATNLAGINATSCTADFIWDGAAWQNVALATATYS